MTKMMEAIAALEKAADGRVWVLIYQSTHPDIDPAKFVISYHGDPTAASQVTKIASRIFDGEEIDDEIEFGMDDDDEIPPSK